MTTVFLVGFGHEPFNAEELNSSSTGSVKPQAGSVAQQDERSLPETGADNRAPLLEPGAAPPPITPATISRNEEGFTTVRAVEINDGLLIDGRLDEDAYQTVEPFGNFIQTEPNAGAPATEKTEAWIFFDNTNLYIAARVWDKAPMSQWVVNEMRRDSFNVLQNEGMGFIIDTFYDRRNGIIFNFNPIGGRMDGEVSNERNYNGDWNPIWELGTGRFEGGWSWEAAIPFKSMRYRPGQSQVWGINLSRTIRHKNESAYLTQLDPGLGPAAIFQVSQSASLVGLKVPPSGRPIEIKPYFIGDFNSNRTTFPTMSNDIGANVGLDLVKYGITDNLTADFTINTDFAQVEADEQQINLTRFSLFFPEKREFFLENQGIFGFGGAGGRGPFRGSPDTPIIFYSRRIGLNQGLEVPIVAGGRMTGRIGKFNLGIINIQTGDKRSAAAQTTNFTIARIRRDLFRRSSIGAIVTNRSLMAGYPGSNQSYGVDATLAFYENILINTYWVKTQTEGTSGRDTSYKGEFRYNGDRYGISAEHLFVDEQFLPGVGFMRRGDLRKSFGLLRFSPRPRSLEAIRKMTWEASVDYITTASGLVETREYQGRFQVEFESSDQFEISYTDTYDYLEKPFRISPNVTIPSIGHKLWNARTSFQFGQQRRLAGNLFTEHGAFYGGTKTAVGFGGGGPFSGRLELNRQLSFEPGISFNWVDLPQGSFATQLLTTRTTYTITTDMFVSALIQFNSSNNALSSNIRLRWEYQPGSELFIVYNEQRDTLSPNSFADLKGRALIVKVNRLFRF